MVWCVYVIQTGQLLRAFSAASGKIYVTVTFTLAGITSCIPTTDCLMIRVLFWVANKYIRASIYRSRWPDSKSGWARVHKVFGAASGRVPFFVMSIAHNSPLGAKGAIALGSELGV